MFGNCDILIHLTRITQNVLSLILVQNCASRIPHLLPKLQRLYCAREHCARKNQKFPLLLKEQEVLKSYCMQYFYF